MLKGIIDDKIDSFDGFHLVYAKKCGSPKNKFFEKRIDVIEFFSHNLNNIDFLSINDVIIDINRLVENNKKLSRYLKLIKIYEV